MKPAPAPLRSGGTCRRPPLPILAFLVRGGLRTLLLFLAVLAALALHQVWTRSIGETDTLAASAGRLEAAAASLQGRVAALEGQSVTALSGAQAASGRAVADRLAEIDRALPATLCTQPSPAALLAADSAAIAAAATGCIDRELLVQEQRFLLVVQARLAQEQVQRRIAALDAAIAADTRRLATIEALPLPQRYAVDAQGFHDLKQIVEDRIARNQATRRLLLAAVRPLPDLKSTIDTARLDPHVAFLAARAVDERERLEATIARQAQRWWQRAGLDRLLWPAAIATFAILLTPLAVRTLFFWVLAPIATRRGTIQLLPPGPSAPLPTPLPVQGSAVSRQLRLGPGLELLLRQGFLQTSSVGGAKQTRWLLDWRHPLTSLAAGLSFLDRITGGPADSVTVSATADPFAEVALLDLPEGAALVLHPRALAGVLLPAGRPLVITSHWRLGTLAAWLTWQLRFLMFHGPATLILQGRRGVRIEPAEAGRIIGEAQLTGFSPGLAYSATRTETFWPYLLGRVPLLKDQVAAGDGLLVAEEAPAPRRGPGSRRGLEGAVDAGLKAFGI